MVRKVVTVDEGLHLPTAVRNQVAEDLESDMETYVTAAQSASSTALLAAGTASSARDAAVVAAGTAVAPTDTMVAGLLADPGSATSEALGLLYSSQVVIAGPGIDITGTTDSTAAIQAIFDSLPDEGGRIYFPAGRYRVSGLVLSKRAIVDGAGGTWDYTTQSANTTLVCTSSTAVALEVTAHGCSIRDLALVNSSSTLPTAGVGLLMTAASGARLIDITISGFWHNVEFGSLSGVYWQMRGCDIIDPVRYGAYLHNTDPTNDWADPVILGCTFTNYTTRTPPAMIRWESGGGVRFTANKINSGPGPAPGGGIRGRALVGLDMMVGDGVTTMDLMATGNSFENCSDALIRIGQEGTTGQFGAITIVGNEFHNSNQAIEIGGPTEDKIHTVTIDGNAFFYLGVPLVAANVLSLVVGDSNAYRDVTGPILALGTGVHQYQLSAPNTATDYLDLIRNESAGVLNANNWVGRCDYTFTREIPFGVNSTSTYTTLYWFDVPQYSSGSIELTFTGQITNIGAVFARRTRYYVTGAPGAAVSMATVGTDVSSGTAPDVFIDTTTLGGRVYVKVRTPAGSGTNSYHGEVTMKLEGPISKIHKGA